MFESVSVEREYYYPRFTEEFISNIKDYVLELSDKDYEINIHEVLYFRWQDDKRYEARHDQKIEGIGRHAVHIVLGETR